jgi:hypothetical protein
VTLTAEPSDLDLIKNATALRCKSLFAAKALADNVGIGPAALEKWLYGHARLAPSAMAEMVHVLFHGRAAWDPVNQRLLDVVKPASAQMSGSDIPHGQIRASAP